MIDGERPKVDLTDGEVMIAHWIAYNLIDEYGSVGRMLIRAVGERRLVADEHDYLRAICRRLFSKLPPDIAVIASLKGWGPNEA
jgi:hypothetical protein